MPENKRYYWLKLKDTFFEDDNIRIIEDMPNGQKYIILYLKLMLKAVKTDGKLLHKSCIPYTPEMLAAIFRTDVQTITDALTLFERLQIVEVLDDGALFMADVVELTGSESTSAERVRKHRGKPNPLQCSELALHCKKNVTPERRDKRVREKNPPIVPQGGNMHLESEQAAQGESLLVSKTARKAADNEVREQPSTTPVQNRFIIFWEAYPRKVGKGAAEKAWDRIRPDEPLLERIVAALAVAIKSDQWQRNSGQFIPNPATWLNQRRWEDEQPGKPESGGYDFVN